MSLVQFASAGGARAPHATPWGRSIGWVAVATTTGLLLVLWVIVHLLGVLSAFQGPAAMDGYAAVLHRAPVLLWAERIGLLALVGLHVMSVSCLVVRARKARGQRAGAPRYRRSTWAARGMPLSGALLLLFIGFHVSHMTCGVIHPAFIEGAVYHNLVTGLAPRFVTLGYLSAPLVLGLHVRHGVFAALAAFAARSSRGIALFGRVALALGFALACGFLSVSAAVALGVLR